MFSIFSSISAYDKMLTLSKIVPPRLSISNGRIYFLLVACKCLPESTGGTLVSPHPVCCCWCAHHGQVRVALFCSRDPRIFIFLLLFLAYSCMLAKDILEEGVEHRHQIYKIIKINFSLLYELE